MTAGCFAGEYRYSDLGSFSPTFFAGTQNDVFTNIHVVTQERPSGLATRSNEKVAAHYPLVERRPPRSRAIIYRW